VRAKIPEGYGKRLVWSGEINELREAQRRLLLIVPMTLVLITLFVYAAVRMWVDVLIVLLHLPLACTGALIALLATRTNFSVSAAMGFLSIFGIAIQDATFTSFDTRRATPCARQRAARPRSGSGPC
jgi:cobalt-zinc-cadmium resistance protein CzcA